MFVILWEFEVKPGSKKRFESVYGPGGAWAKLFARDAAYQGTHLFRDTKRPRVYLTSDTWASRAAYEEFRLKHRAEYAALDAECEALTSSERRLGYFEADAMAATPRVKGGRAPRDDDS
jgi:quinol monooxygenase YgiN